MPRSLFLLPLALALGCQTQVTPLAAPPTASKPPAYLPATPVDLTEVSIAGLTEAVKEQKGKVVLIDVWFLGCGPCVKKFPQVVELHRKYADDGLVVMSLDVFPDELKEQDKVKAFLTKQGATFPNFIVRDDDKALEAWSERYEAEVTPATVLFDRAGEWVRLPKKASPEDVELAVRAALRK